MARSLLNRWPRPSDTKEHCGLPRKGFDVLPYDETRYQLKLMRQLGMIKADLLAGYANAVAASRRWREEIDAPREEWPPPKLDRHGDSVVPDV